MTLVLSQVGWAARRLEGGYKSFRQRVLEDLDSLPARFDFRILCGPTGSGKTALLEAMVEEGQQVLDLEALACHRGSVLGGGVADCQPGQKAFETGLWGVLRNLEPGRPVWAESESRRIGRLHVPGTLFERLRDGECVLIDASLDARVAHLMTRYADLIGEPSAFRAALERLVPQHGHERVGAWQSLIEEARWDELARSLIIDHYDPAYRRGGEGLYRQAGKARPLLLESLEPAALAEAARLLAA